MQIMLRLCTEFRIHKCNFLVVRYFNILDIIFILILCFTQSFGVNSPG